MTQSQSSQDLAFLAGYIEAKGKPKHLQNQSHRRYLMLYFRVVNQGVLELLRTHLKGALVQKRYWRAIGTEAVESLQLLDPYFTSYRREKIRAVLAEIDAHNQQLPPKKRGRPRKR